ncbi:MAG: IMP dehydrogenase [Planctomycetota bacterium]|mgnify:CR=1 FL=1|nr:MAG: IMP dehydrogenase [Planctomycetota bacterium]REJ87044.1 MAG: IMP dehydrogenase [Planctomycetota bacterium]REK25855.1 MAG: IMP dehydrogenase [Planctomycetota bacterium]REK37134.1 MAG: IMP dehydrogenase [Planctomycetota bacterium]
MSIRVALNHKTVYSYDRPAALGPQIVRLRPAPHSRTPVTGYSLNVEPRDHFVNWQQDPHGNFLARYVFPKKTRRLAIEVDLVADMTVINPFDFFVEESADDYPFVYDDWLQRDLKPFLETIPLGPLGTEFLAAIDRSPQNTVDFLVALNRSVQSEISYLIRMEPGVQSPEETLQNRSGSCRDSGWLLVQILRRLGLAARFVSGYLIQLAPDVPSLDGPSGPEADFTDLHAWAEVYIPGAGWIGLDPTSGLLAGEGHIPLACTPEPHSAAPITGAIEECEVDFHFDMKVTRIHEDPRVTKPYTDDEWTRIDSLGKQIDETLSRLDARLTMGGEPTFVSIDDMDGPEWNTEAVGRDKRRISELLIKRLRERFAPGGLLHYGQGKWYPGESLPRWALGCYWRKDGVPVWNDPALIADVDRDYGLGPQAARRFTEHLANELGVTAEWIVPAFEDVAYFLWKEQRLPVNVDPSDPRLDDPEERARMARVFERGVGEPVGFIMPLRRQWQQAKHKWTSGPWPTRSKRMFLLPGDSPIGLRLPLDALPWAPANQLPGFFPRDPMAERPPLPDYRELRQPVVKGRPDAVGRQGISEQPQPSGDHEQTVAPGDVVRTALCVEPREGRLYVFMPPVELLEDYLDLVSAVEQTATRLQTPVVIEGYLPPQDDRLNQVKVTPDPGVIEVNTHPAASWDELVETTTALYDEARQTRLGTEKFDLDGRHTGTGGGNHVVLGGPKPADSPFLRRPDLLKSFVGYWVNHPSLSYLFSGRFIGPTSQAPRVDEGRRDALYELQLAFSLVPAPGEWSPPWLVDRLFRNLLTDLTGNTHRAEFCIDKLYSPDSSSGRLGLVEFRAFEMPPHPRMSLSQQLLIRALLAWFWEHPYDQPVVEWGTALHDRFLLPHFVREDFRAVIDELNRAGFNIERQWYDAHFEFRFPLVGEVTHQDVHVELRTAIEPWYVLGEEPAGGGTVRFVDSSVERMQIKATGLTSPRHLVTCNGRRVPLAPTGAPGEAVAAVRYRAWQPPNCLHPTIAVHTPLVFDVLDQWSQRSIGGCTYHVSHPGGRNYETFPVNAYEAEARRTARFFPFGHTPGPMDVPPREENPAFPLTLDLRRMIS